MEFKNSLDPEIKNLKNYFGASDGGNVLLRNPRILTSGYLMNDPEWSSEPHLHDFAELIFVTAGRGRSTIFNQSYQLAPGDLIVLNPNTPHNESSDPDCPLEFFFTGISDFQIGGLPDGRLLDENCCQVQKTGEYKEQFDTFFTELIRETVHRKTHYLQISEAICSCILTLTLRILNKNSGSAEVLSPHSIRIKEYIDQNFTADLCLSQLSSAVYISQTYLSHVFKADMGVSPMQYLINKRIALAKQLLSTTKTSVSQIAIECGYDDPVYFSQVFKRMVGDSPKKYRSKNAGGGEKA